MAIDPTYSFTLIGTNGKTTTLRFQGVTIDEGTQGADLLAAAVALEALRDELNDVTDANVDAYSFSVAGTQAVGGLPAAADVFEEMAMQLDITPSGEAQKLATSRIPAPSLGLFLGTDGPNRDVADINDADLTAWVGVLATHVLVSDGEAINGIVSGYRRAKGGRTS